MCVNNNNRSVLLGIPSTELQCHLVTPNAVKGTFEEPSAVVPLHASAPPSPMEAEEKFTNTLSWCPRDLLDRASIRFYGWWERGLQMATLC